MKPTDRSKMELNRQFWDEVVPIHAKSALYDVPGFVAGRLSLDELERSEVGDVKGKTLLHLQCHFGLDTLSWVRLGAQATGIDYSPAAISAARRLAEACSLSADFLCCNLYDLPQHLSRQFDIVFTSYGVLCWLPDLKEWARIAASFVKPGGFFYIAEFHPFSYVFNDQSDTLQVRYPYFKRETTSFTEEGTYADREALVTNQTTEEWTYRLGDVVTALLDAGLQLEFLHEHPFTVYEQFPFLEKNAPERWRFPANDEPIPLMFSLRAKKPHH